MCYLPSKFRCHGLYILGATEGGGGNPESPPTPLVVEDQKNPGLKGYAPYTKSIYTLLCRSIV